MYYQLECKTCSVKFLPILATSREELLRPDYEESADVHGLSLEGLRLFHEVHAGHRLDTIEVPVLEGAR